MTAMTFDSPKAPMHPDKATLRREGQASVPADRSDSWQDRAEVPPAVFAAVMLAPSKLFVDTR